MTTKEFEAKLTELAVTKRALEIGEAKIAPLKDHIEELKFEIMIHMQDSKSKRTEPVNGYYVTRTAGRATTRITDTDAALDWLEDNADSDEYLKLDEKVVLKLVEANKRETGELVDWIETTTGPEYLTIKAEKTE